jgi:hypothetical protein
VATTPALTGHNGGVRAKGYRLRMSMVRRVVTVALLVVTSAFFVPGIATGGLELWWRVVSAVGLVLSLLGLRTVLGRVLVVRPEALRIYRFWPLRRDIAWYRILAIDVIPGFWHLEVELNSGERLVLPAVREIEELYESMESHRQALDA